jgi:RNA polymerase sigma-70 factor, ECF subfamily
MMALAVSFPLPADDRSAPLDRALLVRCTAQDPMAFRVFVARHERAVFALLSRIMGRGPSVEDLAQETFVRAYRAFPRFDVDGPAKASTWLLTIATRLALDARKRRGVQTTPLDDERGGPQAAAPGDPEVEHRRRELGRALEAAAATLPDDQRAALVLSEYHGLSLAEIADALEVPAATVKTRVFRAREKMRAALGEEWSS